MVDRNAQDYYLFFGLLILFLVRRGFMFENIHDLAFAEALQLIVNYGLAHDFINIAFGTLDALGLDEVVGIGTLLLIPVNGDES